MKLIDLIKANKWPDVSNTLLSLYPEENRNIKGYEKIFKSFMNYPVLNSEMTLVIEKHEEGDKKDHYTDVYGLQYDLFEKKFIHYGLEITPWQEWLGMTIQEDTLIKFANLEIISHCLYEMTFCGFTEKKIQKFRNEIEKSVKEIKNMSPEEKEKNRIRSEKFFNKIRENSKS
jgi:hypothetical protein